MSDIIQNAMIKELYSSDLEVLLKLFAPKEYELHIFDPYGKLTFNKDFNFCEGVSIPKVLVNLSPEVLCYKSLSLEDFEVIFDFGRSQFSEEFRVKTYHFINNPNRTMRWLFPKDLAHPTFLNFFNSASKKAKIIKKLIQWGFYSPLKNVIKSGKFKLYTKKTIKLERTFEGFDMDNYSIFTGTIGPNRKAVVELNSNGETTHFAKIILNRDSLPLLTNELRTLYALNGEPFQHLNVPSTLPSKDRAVGIFSNIQPKNSVECNQLGNIHFKAINELYNHSFSKEQIQWCSFADRTQSRLSQLKGAKRFSASPYMVNTINNLWQSIDKADLIPLAISHSDFTPWNTYVSNDQLYAYDWELSQKNMPLLFDLFHYIFQTGVLLKHQNFQVIKKEIDQMLTHPLVQQMIEKYSIDVALHYKLYIAINVSYYMNLYEKQEVLHEQATWLMDVWKDALVDINAAANKQTERNFFMNELVGELASKPYALLKFKEQSIEKVSLSSDLDIALLKKELKGILSFIKNHPVVSKTKVYEKSFMTTVELFFNDDSFLSLDFITQFKRKSVELLNLQKVVEQATFNKDGIKVPRPIHDFQYTCLFYWLNHSDVPKKYQNFFQKMPGDQMHAMQQTMVNQYGFSNNIPSSFFLHETDKRKAILSYLQKQTVNKGWKKWKNQLDYIWDSISRITMGRGFIITFSGVDGSGKSTTIDTIAKKLENEFRKEVVVLRHRPSVLPILSAFKYGKQGAEEKSMERLPRTGNNKSTIGSSLRFGYYFMDYLFGQFYVIAKYVMRGKIVLYDRYYYDFINDAKRSNIVLPKWMVKGLFTLLLKPRVNVFLYASPEVILNRKQELDIPSIVQLTRDYRALFTAYDKQFKTSSYLQIENIDLDKTVRTILGEISKAA